MPRQWRNRPLVLLFLFPIAFASISQAQTITRPRAPVQTITVRPLVRDKYKVILTAYPSCLQGGGDSLGSKTIEDKEQKNQTVMIDLNSELDPGDPVCVIERYTPDPDAEPSPPPAISPTISNTVVTMAPDPDLPGVCDKQYNDCSWLYLGVGGIEQSDLSSKNSQTNGFADIFLRYPVSSASVWAEIRFLGAPNNSNTQNIAAVATNPSGTVTASTLSTVGTAIDYVIGVQKDVTDFKSNGKNTLGFILATGATTPLSSQTASVAYSVPAYGTNECTQLQQRFTTARGYSPALPGSATITTTVSAGAATPTMSTSQEYCVVSPTPFSTVVTANGTSTTTAVSGTQINTIAFSPEDRSSFLLKYVAGLRLTQRFATTSTGCTETTLGEDTCIRRIVDFTVGQDQAITGGYLRHLVLKSTGMFPIGNTGVTFFAAAAIRMEKNSDLSPLILNQVPISTGTGAATAGAVTLPSASTFVLPLKQSNRDFYRIGLALDLSKVFKNLFK